MQIREAIANRQSCREFSDRSVSREKLEDLMRMACQAPSAINLQPWQFTVVCDQEVKRLSKKLMRAHSERGMGCKPDNQRPLPQVYLDRQNELSLGMKPILTEIQADFANFINHGSLNFYGAPVVIVATLHKVFNQARAFDVGLAVGWLLLAAQELGLDTCPVGLICAYEDVIKDFLNLPEDRQVLLGIATGYGKPDSPLNRFRTSRAETDEVVRWY